MATQKEIDYQKEYNNLLEKTAKYRKEALKDNKSLTKQILDATRATEKLADSQNDVIDNFSDFTKQISKVSSYEKNIKNLSGSFDNFSGSINELTEEFNQLGIGSSKSFEKIKSGAVLANNGFNKLMGQVKNIDKFRGSLNGLQSNLNKIGSMVGRAFNDKDLVGMKESISSLRGLIPEKEFERLSGIIDKTDFDNFEQFQSLVKELGSTQITSLKKNLMDIASSGAMDELNEDAKQYIKNLNNLVNDPLSNYEDIIKELPKAHDALNKAYDIMGNKANQELSKIEDRYKNLTSQSESLRQELSQAILVDVNAEQALKNISTIQSYIKSSDFELSGDGLVPEVALRNAGELHDVETKINSLREKSVEIAQQIADADSPDEKKRLLKIQKDILKNLQQQAVSSEKLITQTDKYLRIGEQISKNPIGSDKAEVLEENLFKAHFRLKEMSKQGGFLGGAFEKLSKITGDMGTKMKGLAFPMSLLSGSISLAKKVLEIQSTFSKINREIESSGAFATSGTNLTKNLAEAGDKMRNLGGLASAAMGGDAFALGRDEIQSTVGALDQAGMKATALKNIYKDINTTTAASGNEFLKAADTANVFAGALGVSRQEVSSLMGDMFINYTKNAKKIEESFVQISAAAQSSSIGTNRFLGIVQTATAGLSLYEDQVKDTALAITNMVDKIGLTGKEAEIAARSAQEFAQNTDGVIKAFAVLKPDQLAKLGTNLDKDIDTLETKEKEGKISPEEKQKEKQRLDLMRQFADAAKTGDVRTAGAALKYMDTETMNKTMGSLMDTIKGMATQGGKLDIDMLERLGKTMGIPAELLVREIKTGGKISEALNANIEDTKKTMGDLAQDQKDREVLTGDVFNKAIESVKETLVDKLGRISNILLGISALIATLAAGKFLMGIFGKGGGGMGGVGGKALDFLKDKAGSLLGKSKVGGDLVSKASEAGGGLMSKFTGGGFGKKLLGSVGKKGLKGIPGIGSIVSGAMLAKDVMGLVSDFSDGKSFDKGKIASMGMNALGMIPGVGTVATLADMGLDASGAYDSLSSSGVSQSPSAASRADAPLSTNNNIASANTGAGGIVNINIHGGDLGKVRSVVSDELARRGIGTS
jgi:hypothetical protein